jgi:hypothetical protein
MRKTVPAVCVSILTLVLTASCAKPDDGAPVASVSGTTIPSDSANLSVIEQGRRHAQCMRDHGVPEADPRPNDRGGVTVGGGYDKHTLDQDVLDKAIEACKPYQVVLPPDELAAKLAGARETAQCMRAHGVENYPDPDPNDLGRSIPDEVRDDPEYDEAKEICDTRPASPGATS